MQTALCSSLRMASLPFFEWLLKLPPLQKEFFCLRREKLLLFWEFSQKRTGNIHQRVLYYTHASGWDLSQWEVQKKKSTFFKSSLAIYKKRRYIKESSIRLSNNGGLIAQSVEHRPFKAVVPGSSPGQPTIFFVFIYKYIYASRGVLSYARLCRKWGS